MAESVLIQQMTPLLILTMRLAWLSLFSWSRWPHFSNLQWGWPGRVSSHWAGDLHFSNLQWGWHGWVSSYSTDDPTSHTYSEAQWHLLSSLTLTWPWSSACCSPGFNADVSGCRPQSGVYRTSSTLARPSLNHMCVVFSGSMLMTVHANSRVAFIDLFNLGLTLTWPSVCHFSGLIIIISNTYIAPNPNRPAQSSSHFKTRMNIRINTWNMHTPDDPTPTAKRRQTCTHPGTVSATQTCTAAIHGPWAQVMITKQIQRAAY